MVYFSVAEDKCDLFLFLERRILPERLFITEIFTQNQSRSARSVRPSIIYIEDKRFKRKKKNQTSSSCENSQKLIVAWKKIDRTAMDLC